MIQFEELRLQLLEDEDALKELSSALGLEEMRKEVATLEEQTAADGFWEDRSRQLPKGVAAREYAKKPNFGL